MSSRNATYKYEPGSGVKQRSRSVVVTLVITCALFVLLPFTQLIANLGKQKKDLVTVDVTIPPPPPPPPDPPVEEEENEEPPPEMEKPVEQLSLSQMDLALNLGVGDAMSGAFAFGGFDSAPDAVSELDIFDVSDLDRAPSRLKTVPPAYPPELRRARITGEVVLLLLIDQNGRVTVEDVISSTAREFERAAIMAAEQCIFESPTKDGKAVKARYRMKVPFRI
jgi:protein TonB